MQAIAAAIDQEQGLRGVGHRGRQRVLAPHPLSGVIPMAIDTGPSGK